MATYRHSDGLCLQNTYQRHLIGQGFLGADDEFFLFPLIREIGFV